MMSSNRIIIVGSLVVVAISALAFMMFANTDTNSLLLSLKQYVHVSRDGTTINTKVPIHNRDGDFTLTCPDMTESGGLLPFANTCLPANGGISPALQWSGAPGDTKQYMLAMWSRADSAVCNRYEWVLYNIPASTTSIAAGNVTSLPLLIHSCELTTTFHHSEPTFHHTSQLTHSLNPPSHHTHSPGNPDNIGTFGGSFPGVPKYEYASPCPDGTGYKTYYFTLYALNDDLGAYVDSVNDDYYKRVGPELLLEVPLPPPPPP